MSDVSLTSSARQALLSVKSTAWELQQTQHRLTTGKKVGGITDDALAYLYAASLTNQASGLVSDKSNLDQSISSVSTALVATQAADTLLQVLKGVVESAQGGSLSDRVAATQSFKEIGTQLAQLTKDATYQGLNLLTSSNVSLSTNISGTTATLNVNGVNLAGSGATAQSLFTGVSAFAGGQLQFSQVVSGQLNTPGTVKGFSSLTLSGVTGSNLGSTVANIFAQTENSIDTAISHLRGISASLGTNVALLSIKSDFSANFSAALNEGADKLTLADLNTEAANNQAVQLRNKIGIQSLALTNEHKKAILSLLH